MAKYSSTKSSSGKGVYVGERSKMIQLGSGGLGFKPHRWQKNLEWNFQKKITLHS